MASSCCGEVDIDAAVVCAFLRDLPTGVPALQVGLDAFGACVTAEAVTTAVSVDVDNILVKGTDGGAYLAIEDTASIDLTDTTGTLKADVKISATPPAGGYGNPIQVLPDGLRVIAREAIDWQTAQLPVIPGVAGPPCSGMTLGDVIMDAAGFLRTAPTKSVPSVSSTAESYSGAIPVGPHAINVVVVQGPIVVTTVNNTNADKSLNLTVVPVNYGKRQLQNVGAVLAAGLWKWNYELLYAAGGGAPVTSVSSPAVEGSGRTTAFTPGAAIRADSCEVRGENSTMVYNIAPCSSLELRHRAQVTTNGSANPVAWTAGIAHDMRGFLHLIAIPRKDN